MLLAVFEIYFSSPLDQGMTLIRTTSHPSAKRVVLIVADGLRAEAMFGENTNRTPFLTDIIQHNGSWGVAHTRMPTESRPGHVALLAGIYEDPSAILKGWKANPVDFDSVINESANAWCWGSPDIMNLFNKDNHSHIHFEMYDADLQDFGNKNTSILDTWVFNKVEKFLNKYVFECKTNCDAFAAEGNLFFLHLLGIDTAGHGFKPHSNEYINNIKLVDANVEKISKLFDKVFPDKQTTFVFTADHGMTNWGAHGSGSLHETETPFIAWGSGIKINNKQQDINQIDIAPFLASLIGRNIPSNSLGVLPLNYLNLSKQHLAELQFNNMLQLLEIFNLKRLRTEKYALIFKPYKKLTSVKVTKIVEGFRTLQNRGEFDVCMETCGKFIMTLIDGIEYYHNYYQYPLLMSISFGLIGWITYLVGAVLNVKMPCSNLQKNYLLVAAIDVFPIGFCYINNFPLSYYIYFTFPFISFSLLFNYLPDIFSQISYHSKSFKLIIFLGYGLGLELLVYGFFHRATFSLLMFLISFWIFFVDSFRKYANKYEKISWFFFCWVIGIFPFASVMDTEFNMFVYIHVWALWMASYFILFITWMRKVKRLKSSYSRNLQVSYKIFIVQYICLMMTGPFSVALEYGYIANNSVLKNLSWILFILPISLIPFSSKLVTIRIFATFLGFTPFYLLVSLHYDGAFLFFYAVLLYCWLAIEIKVLKSCKSSNVIIYAYFQDYESTDHINAGMFRRGFLFMVFIFIGFFGIGNSASLNSFDPMWVRAFLTVFSPFKMMGLILLKITIPFLFCCCIFCGLNTSGKVNVLQLFSIILLFSDVMVLNFLYLITNKGSWLDIGSSLSHFIIMDGFVMILLILYGFAHLLTSVTYSDVYKKIKVYLKL